MSTSETDPDKAAEANRKERLKKTYADGREGRLSKRPRRTDLQDTSIKPRNRIEQVYMDKFGSVAPIPHATLRRSDPYRVAAVLHIHHSVPVTRVANFLELDPERLQKVAKEDGWSGMINTLLQVTNVSQLSVIPTHNAIEVEKEMKRRQRANDALMKREEMLVGSLKGMEAGSKEEATTLSNIKKIRDMLDQTTGLGDYLKEVSSARGSAMKLMAEAKAKEGMGDDAGKDMKPSKGKIINT